MKLVFIPITIIFLVFTIYLGLFIPIHQSTLQQGLAVKWHDSLFNHLPQGIDTTILVADSKGSVLKFRQYIKPLFNHEAIIYQEKGAWKLHRTTKSAYDSMSRDDFAVARVERAAAFRTIDTVKSWQIKLEKIAHDLAQADYVLVIKNQRKMFIQRKGKNIITFPIELGFKPVGKKVFEGDGKTPEGIYHLDNKYYRDDKFYKSFWISYPNETEKAIAKSKGSRAGVGIMIHGTNKANTNATDWTAGCIALQNKDIDILFNRVASGTIIEIRR